MRVGLSLVFALLAAGIAVEEPKTVTKVVNLLQGMLEKSKSDGDNDRDAFAKFKCYCDSNIDQTKSTIAQAESDIDSESTFLADRRAANEKLSQEVANLKASMDENAESRSEASTIRGEQNMAFITSESDMETAISQMERAIDLLSAVGADQTANTGADSTRFMAAGHVAAAGGLIEKGTSIKELDSDMKAALRAASVFLSSAERKSMTSFVQAPFTGQYTSQSTEIIGIVKNMNDTFNANLAAARTQEAKELSEHRSYMRIAVSDWRTMDLSWRKKKTEVGNNARDIGFSTTELGNAQTTLNDSNNFLSDLTNRCSTKAKEFEQRKMLRANEEAAVAQAIAILNSDDSFDTFGGAAATSTGATALFVETRARSAESMARHEAVAQLVRSARSMKSMKLARVASALVAENPFVEVLSMINETITQISSEGADDLTKKTWCLSEQLTGNGNKAQKISEISGYNGNIGTLDISKTSTENQIRTTKSELVDYKASQDAETATRSATNTQFKEELSNLQEAEKILTKATEVLAKYYEWLHRHNGAHTYANRGNVDSGGGNLEKLNGKTNDELEAACSERPECVGFNTEGWLKSELAPSNEWYAWDGGQLFEKVMDQTAAQAASLLQQPAAGENDGSHAIAGEDATWGSEMEGQRGQGNEVITMLKFITGETVKERNNAIATEQSAQNSYETLMNQLAANIQGAETNLQTYGSNLAQTNSDLETAHENLKAATAEKVAIVKYLADIEPGCTFMISNFETREANRLAETTALQGAITTLKNTPAFQAAQAEEDREKLGKCRGVCVSKGNAHAECQACLEGVTVYGYCVQNSGAEGCDTAIPTGSAASIA